MISVALQRKRSFRSLGNPCGNCSPASSYSSVKQLMPMAGQLSGGLSMKNFAA